MISQEKKCLACDKELVGRRDKKFCDPYCKSAFHYKKVQEDHLSFYAQVDRQLKVNRKILKFYNRAGKTTVRSEVLIEKGFNPRFFTHYWKNSKKEIYYFVYEFGFQNIIQNNRRKFSLVTWQPYMEKKK